MIKLLINAIYPISLYARQIAGTFVILFLARYLSVYDYGIFSSYKTIAIFLLIFANLGFSDYILVSSQKNIKEVRLKIGLFIINAILLVICISLLSFLTTIQIKYLFILILIRQFFDGVFFSLALPYFQAANKFRIISCVNIFYSIATIIITAICYLNKLSLLKFLILSVLLGLLNFIQVSYFVHINYFSVLRHIKLLISKIDKSIFSYIGVTLCNYLYNQLPALFVSIYIDKKQAALYFSAYTITMVINLLLAAQCQKMTPEMIGEKIDKIKKIISFNLKFLMSINVIIITFFAIYGKWLLNLIYSKPYYSNAYFILLLLALGNIFIALAAIYGTYITASGNQKMKIKMQVEAIVITVVSLLIFYKLEIYAAVIAYILSALHIGVRYVLKAKQLLKTD